MTPLGPMDAHGRFPKITPGDVEEWRSRSTPDVSINCGFDLRLKTPAERADERREAVRAWIARAPQLDDDEMVALATLVAAAKALGLPVARARRVGNTFVLDPEEPRMIFVRVA